MVAGQRGAHARVDADQQRPHRQAHAIAKRFQSILAGDDGLQPADSRRRRDEAIREDARARQCIAAGRAGEIFGLLGPNGAGKTTLIRTILDIIKPDTGRLEVFGRLFQPDDRDRIGYLPEERGLYPRQPVGAVLEYMGRSRAWPAPTPGPRRSWLERLGLLTRGAESRAAVEGQPAKVQVAATLIARPEIVILDEPLSGLDPVSARLVTGVIRDYAAAGHTVLLSTHQMGMVESLCTRVTMIAAAAWCSTASCARSDASTSNNAIRVQLTSDSDRAARRAGRRRGVGRRLRRRPPAAAGQRRRFPPLARRDRRAVEHFERLSTPLEEIFVRVQPSSPWKCHEQGAAHRAVGVPGDCHARAYIFAVVAMPLLFGIIGAIPVISTRSAASSSADLPVAPRRSAASSTSSWRRESPSNAARRDCREHLPELVPVRPEES